MAYDTNICRINGYRQCEPLWGGRPPCRPITPIINRRTSAAGGALLATPGCAV